MKLEEELLAMQFCCALVQDKGLQASTVASYFGQVQGWHAKEHGIRLASGMKLSRLPAMLKGLRRVMGSNPRAVRRGVAPSALRRGMDLLLDRSVPAHANIRAALSLALQGLLRSALKEASVEADVLSVHEAHGTGTALGDPIEAGSLAAAVLTEQRPGDALVCDGIKANLGHGESTAGLTGMLKLAIGLRRAQAAPNPQLLKGLRSPSTVLLLAIAAAQLFLQAYGRGFEEDFNNFHDFEHWPCASSPPAGPPKGKSAPVAPTSVSSPPAAPAAVLTPRPAAAPRSRAAPPRSVASCRRTWGLSRCSAGSHAIATSRAATNLPNSQFRRSFLCALSVSESKS